MKTIFEYLRILLIAVLFFPICKSALAESYNLVLQGGRVIDPESRLDAVRSIGINNGEIVKLSETDLKGKEIVNVAGLVVSPGFIDLHAHGQNNIANDYQARDGVTTALEMEMGVYPVAKWYKSRQGKAIINYGATVSHSITRALALHDTRPDHDLDVRSEALGPEWSRQGLDGADLEKLDALIEQGIKEGGLGIGMALAYLPSAQRSEVFRVFQKASARSAPVFVHARVTSAAPDRVNALQEIIANTASTDAVVHMCHIGSTGSVQAPLLLEMIDSARQNGIDLSTEVYPYTAAHTFIGAAIFSGDWRGRSGIDYQDLQWTLTGERLTEKTFHKYQRKNPEGKVVAFLIPEETVQLAVAHPGVMIASDGGDWNGNAGHPRGAGTFSRVLGRYVREQKLLSLHDALAKMTIEPAKRLESYVPVMKNKGRIKVGADADITVFKAEEIIDRATFEKPMQYSKGVMHVLVNGEFVVKNGGSVKGVFPGQAITSR